MRKKISKTDFLGFCLALLVGVSAHAAPLLYLNERVDLGNGLTGYDFWIDANDLGQDSPYGNYNGARTMAVELTFSGGNVMQAKAYGVINVNTASDALLWNTDPYSAYQKSNDSYYYNDIWSPLLHEPRSTSSSFYLHLATQPGGIFNRGHLAYIVTDGGLSVDGRIARFGSSYDISHDFVSVNYSSPLITGSMTPVPEPATAALLGAGLIGVLQARKRQKNASMDLERNAHPRFADCRVKETQPAIRRG